MRDVILFSIVWALWMYLCFGFISCVFGVEREKQIDVIASIIVHEAGGEGDAGMVLVADTIQNRVERQKSYWGYTPYEVATKASQYSAYRPNSGSFALEGQARWAGQWPTAHRLATALVDGRPITRVQIMGATHYHTREVQPYWSRDPRMQYLGSYKNHLFYREE